MGDERDLVRRWQAGDLVAADELLRIHRGCVERFFATKVDADLGSELLQRSLVECASVIGNLRDSSSFRTFLLVIARRQLYRHFAALRLRKRLQTDPQAHSLVELSDHDGDAFVVMADRRKLLRALRRIPLELQITLELYYWEGLPTAEIAEVLEVPQGTIKSRLRRARRALEELMGAPKTDSSTTSRGSFGDWARRIRKQVRR